MASSLPKPPGYTSTPDWANTAPSYGTNVGRTSAHAAAQLIQLSSKLRPVDETSVALDNGAGAGAITVQLVATKAHIIATDIHQSMLDSILVPPGTKLETRVADARSLAKTLHDKKGLITHAFTTFMLQTITTPIEALGEMKALLKSPGGVIGVAVWAQQNDPFEIWEKACQTIDSTYRMPAAPFDDPNAWRTQEQLSHGLTTAGFKDVTTEDLVMPFPFDSVSKYMDFWFGSKNPAAVNVMSNWKGSMDEARLAVEKVCKEQYDGGKSICTKAVLGIGRV